MNFHLCTCNMIFVILLRSSFHSDSHRFVSIDNTSVFGLAFPNTAAGFSRQFSGVLQGIAAGIGISNYLRAFFMVCFNYSPSGSMKKIPRNFLVLSSLGFSTAHFCFSLSFDASDISFQISGHRESGLEVVCSLVSIHPLIFVQHIESCETCPCI